MRKRPFYWGTCAQCGQAAPHFAHGLCRMCYAYQHRTGRPRPTTLDGPPRTCAACGRLVINRSSRRGRSWGCCHACYMLWYNATTGRTRRTTDPQRVAAVERQRIVLRTLRGLGIAASTPEPRTRRSVAPGQNAGHVRACLCLPLAWLLAALVAGAWHG